MAVKRTRTGYQLWWYDAEGKFRKRTIKGIARDDAVRLEREILAARDRGERQPDERHAPLFDVFASQWIEESRAGWKASTVAQYQQVLKSQLLPAFSDLRVSAITESRMRQLLTQLQDAGLSARRINLALLVLKMIRCTRPGTRSLRMPWPRARRRPGSRRCWDTRAPRCCSVSTRVTSRTGHAETAAHSCTGWRGRGQSRNLRRRPLRYSRNTPAELRADRVD